MSRMRCAFGNGERHDCAWLVCALLIAVAVRVTPVSARGTPPAADPPPLTAQQLEQLVAPIALYPDDLLSQVLMASTYPLEVVQAARWASQNASVTGNLRQRADTAGNLKTSQQQKVSRVSMAGPSGQPVERIVVERADPETVYVPVYDPGVAYGTWPYPDYPPYYWQPPGWVPGTFAYGAMGFAAGAVVGAAIWGGANWWGGNVNINANRYNSFNRTNIAGGNWSHNVAHRGNVPYRNNATAQRFGGQTGAGRAQAGQGNRQVGQGGRQGAGAGNRQAGAGQKGVGQGQHKGGGQKAAQNRAGAGQKAANKGGGNRSANRVSTGAVRSGNINRGGGAGMHRAAAGMNRSMGGGMRMSGGGGMRGGGGRGGGRGGRRSDINVKHDIALLGHLGGGLGFYRFSYNGSDRAYVGVMAQEVQFVRPEAVSRGSDGTLRVRYDMLGLKFQTYDQWIRSGARVPAAVQGH